MLLTEDKKTFVNIIEIVSRNTRTSQSQIEKDYYAISILKELVSRNSDFVFKGGTSLSVCQGIINRFSEDIDISYAQEHITVGQRKAIKRAFFDSIEAVSLEVSNKDNIRSRRAFNRYKCNYASAFGEKSDTVIVEWADITPSFPIEIKTAQTLIGKYLEETGRNDLVEKYNLQKFEVKTLKKERILVDKIFAICDYHISKKLERQSRHIYDIYCLLKHVALDDSFLELFKKVRTYREQLDSCYSLHIDKKISILLEELIADNTFMADYDLITYPLLFDNLPYNEAIKGVGKVKDFLKENNL